MAVKEKGKNREIVAMLTMVSREKTIEKITTFFQIIIHDSLFTSGYNYSFLWKQTSSNKRDVLAIICKARKSPENFLISHC